MRRMITTAAVAVTALAIPGAAIASHQGEQQARANHHGVHQHKRHHRHAHLVRFGNAANTQAAGPTGSTSPAPVAGSPGETAGTIASFTNGTLTITLNDGSTVSGKVTEGTEIECRSAMLASAASDGHGDSGGQGDQGDDRGNDGQSNSGPGHEQQGDLSGHDDGDDDEQQQEAQNCTSAAFVTGAVVGEAELRVSSAGAVWEKVELDQ